MSYMHDSRIKHIGMDQFESALKMPVSKITYYLNKLISMEYINDHIDRELPTKYSLTEKGLSYLVEHDLI